VSEQLILCDECARHVKVWEKTCPFCGAESFRPSVRDPFRRIAAAAAVAAGVTALTACSSDRSTGAIDMSSQDGSATMTFTSTAVMYGYPGGVDCVYANGNYANGATWSCGCNTCSCNGGVVTTTFVACNTSSDASEPDGGSSADAASDGSLGDSATDASFGDAGLDADAPDGSDE
jgi:hypothetical protein